MRIQTSVVVLMWLSSITAGSVFAQDWSAFRGSKGDGISMAKNVPTEWSPEFNIAWKVGLTGQNNGSPVVFGDRVFLTCADAEGHKRQLHCFHAPDGSSRWIRTVDFDRTLPTHKTNLYGGTTPATDGQRIVVWHGSAGLHCYDMDGSEQWKQDLGEFRHQWGYGTSPVIHGDRVILHTGPGKEVFVAAFSLQNGELLWRTDEPLEGDGEHNAAKQYMGSWSTPVIVPLEGKDVAVCSMATRVNGYDIQTGEILWTCEGLRGERGDLAYTSPVIADDICVAMGGYQGPAIGFRMLGKGNITEQHRLWRIDRGNPQRIGSGVFVDGHIYMANAGANTIECIDPATGKQLWQQRSPAAACWGSLVLAEGRLYTTDQEGATVVFRPNPEKFELLGVNKLNSPGNSTMAVADGSIYLRTFDSLFCIRETEPR
jgi:outer membrane protein assembly factor BamB